MQYFLTIKDAQEWLRCSGKTFNIPNQFFFFWKCDIYWGWINNTFDKNDHLQWIHKCCIMGYLRTATASNVDSNHTSVLSLISESKRFSLSLDLEETSLMTSFSLCPCDGCRRLSVASLLAGDREKGPGAGRRSPFITRPASCVTSDLRRGSAHDAFMKVSGWE